MFIVNKKGIKLDGTKTISCNSSGSIPIVPVSSRSGSQAKSIVTASLELRKSATGGGTMTAQMTNRFMLVGLVLAAVGGIGTAMSFALGYDIGAAKYLVTPLTLIGIGMMVAAKFTPVQD